ncbi:MAG: phage holin family protein [Cytophagales bacterium]|nr:phage holin family protein [Cytophagales bacterium]
MDKLIESILKFLRLDTIVQHLWGFFQDKFELVKSELRDELAKALAQALLVGTMILIGFMFLLFISLGLAHYIISSGYSSYVGYGSVAGFYGVLFLIFLLFRNSIYGYLARVMSGMIKKK